MSGDPEVLVVGSGPTGLTLACELVRRGVHVRTIEQLQDRPRESRAIWVMPRTLEILDSLGVGDKLIARGQRVFANEIYTRNRRIASVGFGRIGPTRYPFALVIPQSEVEDALVGRLCELGGSVEHGVALRALDSRSDDVAASVEIGGHRTDVIRADWLVGCDGHRSATRDLLDVSFPGEPYATTLLIADSYLDGNLDRDRSHTFQGRSGALLVIPLPNGLTRTVVYGPSTEGHITPSVEAMHELMHQYGPPGLSLSDPRWLSAFRIQRRIADHMRVGRCYLAGDAAHVHSPFGGQGMNTGIQDAANLGWKLAAVSSGNATDSLLNTYELERRPVAQRVLRDSDRQTKAFLQMSGARAVARDAVIRGLGAAGVLDRRIGTSLAGYFDSYRDSPLTHRQHRGQAPHPGDRLPDVIVPPARQVDWDGPTRVRSLHAHLATDALTVVLVLDDRRPGDLRALNELAENARVAGAAVLTVLKVPPGALDAYAALAAGPRIDDPSGALSSLLGAKRGGALLVRPDGYLVCRAQPKRSGHLIEHVMSLAGLKSRGDLVAADRS